MPLDALKKAFKFAMSDDGSLKKRVIRSGLWVSLREAMITLIGLFKSIVLARLLSPDMFGLMGLCSLALSMVETFTRPGISQALIQRQSSFDDARDTAFTLLVARGLLLTALLAIVAPSVARFYGSDELKPMLQALSIVFLIGGFTNINLIGRQKELEFRQISYITQLSALLGTIPTIACAFWLRNVWALVIGQIATTLTSTLLSYYFIGGKPRLSFDRKVARELLSYGKFITASSIVIFVATNLDTAVIGKLLGTQELGYYVLAFTIANLIASSLSKLASSIMMPAYSKLQADKAALRQAYLRTLQIVMFATLPATLGAFLTAEFIVHVVYGEKWAGAVIPLQLLLIFGFLRGLASINGYLFEGIGRPHISLYVGLLRLSVLAVLIIPMTTRFGLAGAAASVTIAMMVQWLCFFVFANRTLSISFRHTMEVLWSPIWKSCVMAAAVMTLALYVDGMTNSGLAVLVLVGASVYLGLNARMLITISRVGG
jgi:O-antigen/teichoic acid export membrane protein